MFVRPRSAAPPSSPGYAVRWFVIGCIAALTAHGLRMAGIAIDSDSLWLLVELLCILLFPVPVSLALASMVPQLACAAAYFVDFMLSLLQLIAVAQIFMPVSYLAATAGAHVPLLDTTLSWLDATLFGFDWNAADRWVADRPAIEGVLLAAYHTMFFQALALLVLGSLLRPCERNAELIWLALVSLTITMAVFAFTPALGMAGRIGNGHIDLLEEIRSGNFTIPSNKRMEGIVNFPSFHTTLAVLYPYVAGRLHKRLLLVFLPLNTTMILSIPVIGGHYLVDLFGGTAVAFVSIVTVRLIGATRSVRLATSGTL
jgi:membrane-associated phospholipid phosphatase